MAYKYLILNWSPKKIEIRPGGGRTHGRYRIPKAEPQLTWYELRMMQGRSPPRPQLLLLPAAAENESLELPQAEPMALDGQAEQKEIQEQQTPLTLPPARFATLEPVEPAALPFTIRRLMPAYKPTHRPARAKKSHPRKIHARPKAKPRHIKPRVAPKHAQAKLARHAQPARRARAAIAHPKRAAVAKNPRAPPQPRTTIIRRTWHEVRTQQVASATRAPSAAQISAARKAALPPAPATRNALSSGVIDVKAQPKRARSSKSSRTAPRASRPRTVRPAHARPAHVPETRQAGPTHAPAHVPERLHARPITPSAAAQSSFAPAEMPTGADALRQLQRNVLRPAAGTTSQSTTISDDMEYTEEVMVQRPARARAAANANKSAPARKPVRSRSATAHKSAAQTRARPRKR